MATSPIGPTTSNTTTHPASTSAADAIGNKAPTEQMFLQLLIAQIKNQNPMNPQDSTQFVSQLAQFSQLEQTLAIRKNSDTLVNDFSQLTTPTTPATPGA